MWYPLWLVPMAMSGWAAGQIVSGKRSDGVGDILLGLTGGLSVQFGLEAAGVRIADVYTLLFSVWGAAALAALVRYLLRRYRRVKAQPLKVSLQAGERRVSSRVGSRDDSQDHSRAA